MHAIATGLRQVGRDLTRARQAVRLRGRMYHARRGARARHRVILGAALTMGLLMLLSLPAFADGPGEAGKIWLSWMKDKDSHGNQVGAYYLRVSQGGVTDPITAMGAFLLTQFWSLYVLLVMVTVWALDFVLQFHALNLVRVPASIVAGVLHDTIGTLGIVGLAATISVFISSFWVLRGRTGAGFGEMAVSVVIVGLLGTALANPVGLVTGPDGAIAKSQQAGSALTVNLLKSKGVDEPTAASDMDQAPKMVQSAASAKILDIFVRTPSQLINYGMTFDTPGVPKKCKDAYEKATKGGSVGPMKDDCPKVVKDTMEHPQNSLIAIPVVLPAVFLLIIFVLVLLLVTLFLTALAGFEAAVFIVRLVKAIFPGAAREDLFTATCTVAVCCALLIGSIMSLGVLVLALAAVFDQTRGWNIVPIYLFVDLMLLVMVIGLAMAFRAKKHGKKFGKKAADALSPKPVSLNKGSSGGAKVMAGARTAASMVSNRRLRDTLSTSGAAAAGGAIGGAAGAHAVSKPGKSERPGVVRTAAKLTGKAAVTAAAYTVGAPVAIPRATKAAQSAMAVRKTAMAHKLQQAKGSVQQSVDRKVQGVRDYAAEYKHNVGVAARFVGSGLAQTGAAMAGVNTMDNKPANKKPPAPGSGDKPRIDGIPVKGGGVERLNQLRSHLGHEPLRAPTPKPTIPATPTTSSAPSVPVTSNPGAQNALSDLQRRLAQQKRTSAVAAPQTPAPATPRRHIARI